MVEEFTFKRNRINTDEALRSGRRRKDVGTPENRKSPQIAFYVW